MRVYNPFLGVVENSQYLCAMNGKTVGTGKCLAQHLQCHLRGGLSFRGCCIIQIPSLEGKRMERDQGTVP